MNIYLDWAASATTNLPCIQQAFNETQNIYANPSAQHAAGKKANNAMQTARKKIAEIIQTPSDSLYFTSGGTESNHIPLLATLLRTTHTNIAISRLEHPSLLKQAETLKKIGKDVRFIPANINGIITPEAVLNCIDENTQFIAVMCVNNETGAIQPIREIVSAVRKFSFQKRHIHIHADAVQSFGKISMQHHSLGVDSFSISGHKLGAPKGIGLLYLKKPITPFLTGGEQEHNIRSGTENLFGITALAHCIQEELGELQKRQQKAEQLMQFFIEELQNIDGAQTIPKTRKAADSRFSPWILQCALKNIPAEMLVRLLSEKGIYISTGSACSSKKKSRPVLEAMGVSKELQLRSVRISIGRETTKNELEYTLHEIKKIVTQF